ncbi:MAG: lytic murein transglycosylase [Pseudohongiellaceae bacterium]
MFIRPIRNEYRTILRMTACLLLGALFLSTPASAQDDEASSEEFRAFLEELRSEALEQGISESTLDAVLPGIRQHRRAVEADRSQAEFVQTYADYLERVSPARVRAGRELMDEHGRMIRDVAANYDVQPRFIVSILGLESNYGSFPITEPLFDVVATLAFDRRRSAQFRREFMAALEIVDAGYATPEMMKSSWAGALGAPQFTPSSFLALAVDHDNDGHINLWEVGPDVIASVANYLRNTGWRDDQTWGRVVSLPPGGEQSLPAPQDAGMQPDPACRRYTTMGAWRGLNDWQELGVRREDGTALPTRNLPAALIVGDEGDDKGYLVYRNFCSIMRYNPAFRYALAVGLLSDRIADIRD